MRAGAFGCSCLLLPYWDVPSDLMLGCPPRCWAHLAGVSGEVKMYSGSSIIVKIYPALSATIRGRDGVDASRCIWMYTNSAKRLSALILTVALEWLGASL